MDTLRFATLVDHRPTTTTVTFQPLSHDVAHRKNESLAAPSSCITSVTRHIGPGRTNGPDMSDSRNQHFSDASSSRPNIALRSHARVEHAYLRDRTLATVLGFSQEVFHVPSRLGRWSDRLSGIRGQYSLVRGLQFQVAAPIPSGFVYAPSGPSVVSHKPPGTRIQSRMV